jgi:hypothetical protein
MIIRLLQESISRVLKPESSVALNVRAKARTYLRSNRKSNRRFLRFASATWDNDVAMN